MTDAKPTAADLNRRIDQCAARQADMKSRITKLGPTAGKTESDKAALEAISKLGSTSLVSSDADMSTVSRDMSDADIADMSSKIDSVEFEVHRLEGFLTDMESEWEKSEDLFRSGPNPPGHADDGHESSPNMTQSTQPSATPDDDPRDQPQNRPHYSSPSSSELDEPAPIAPDCQRDLDSLEAKKKTLDMRIARLLLSQNTTNDIDDLVKWSRELEKASKTLADYPVDRTLKEIKKNLKRIERAVTRMEARGGRGGSEAAG
ncbi:hypothetical protein BU16DRAFT_535356 [Lophium mytilinum]|uniref:Uncharacterized protein n=1 Tax=Lophium mytilinum TaxID=390894 RepID=A0A6A6R8L5_9PEZI|nr:hypothetical protein BU16DRAFT_535356 [Lophium mytilinum]